MADIALVNGVGGHHPTVLSLLFPCSPNDFQGFPPILDHPSNTGAMAPGQRHPAAWHGRGEWRGAFWSCAEGRCWRCWTLIIERLLGFNRIYWDLVIQWDSKSKVDGGLEPTIMGIFNGIHHHTHLQNGTLGKHDMKFGICETQVLKLMIKGTAASLLLPPGHHRYHIEATWISIKKNDFNVALYHIYILYTVYNIHALAVVSICIYWSTYQCVSPPLSLSLSPLPVYTFFLHDASVCLNISYFPNYIVDNRFPQ